MRRLFYGSASLGVVIQASSGWWDVFSHRIEFVDEDPFLNPAHIGLYSGTLILVASVLLAARKEDKIPGLGLLKLIVATQLLAGLTNEIIHKIPSLETLLDFYIHSAFTLAMLLAALIIFIDAALYSAVEEQADKWLPVFTSASGAALWMFSSGSTLYLLHENVNATVFILGFTASVIINTSSASAKRLGAALLTALIYSTLVYLILTMYVGAEPYPPISPLTVLVIEFIVMLVARRGFLRLALLTGGALYGALAKALYYPLLEQLNTSLISYSGAAGGLAGGLVILLAGEHVAKIYISKSISDF